MRTVILCGGLGTRLAEETDLRPKPMVTVGGHPILWHILNMYGSYGFNNFTLALGYKGAVIKEYFLNYYSLDSDLQIDLSSGKVDHLRSNKRNWKLDLIDTGTDSMTGGRLHRLKHLLRAEGTFMLTYGDGVSDVDINKLVAFHRSHGKLATVTAVRPPARFGGMVFDGDQVTEFREKPQTGEGWINGGFFIFEPGVFDYLDGDATVLEGAPLEELAQDGQLMAYKHEGFWQCMDTIRDRQLLEHLWLNGRAPWKNW
jgi:glucose-1-phosphate cytidylyltransferase